MFYREVFSLVLSFVCYFRCWSYRYKLVVMNASSHKENNYCIYFVLYFIYFCSRSMEISYLKQAIKENDASDGMLPA